jgi:hypothetical protein
MTLPFYLSLDGALLTLAERLSEPQPVGSELSPIAIATIVKHEETAKHKLTAALRDGGLTAEGQLIHSAKSAPDDPEYQAIPQGWWAVCGEKGTRIIGSRAFVDTRLATTPLLGMTEVSWAGSKILWRDADGGWHGYRAVRVAAAEFDRLWPPLDQSATISSTGMPGRPSKSAQLIENEFRRRTDSGLASSILADEARSLLIWIETEHPEAPRPTPKVIENNIRAAHRDYKARFAN